MIKTGYKLNQYSPSTFLENDVPWIVKTNVDDPDCVSWQETKKQLRAWYLNEVRKLRKISEKDYFQL